MNALSLRVLVVVLTLALLASTADAQRRTRRSRAVAAASATRYGLHAGYNVDVDDALLGAQVSWPVTPRVALYPSFDYYFVDPGSLWGLNVDLKFRPPTRFGVLYFGGGLNVTRASAGGQSDSQSGLNLLLGFEGIRARTAPYVEAKFILDGGSSFQIVGGFSWR